MTNRDRLKCTACSKSYWSKKERNGDREALSDETAFGVLKDTHISLTRAIG